MQNISGAPVLSTVRSTGPATSDYGLANADGAARSAGPYSAIASRQSLIASRFVQNDFSGGEPIMTDALQEIFISP